MNEFNTGDFIIWEDDRTQPPDSLLAGREYRVEYHDNDFNYITSNGYWTDDFYGYIKKEEYILNKYGFSKGERVYCIDLNLYVVIYNLWVDDYKLTIDVTTDNGDSYYTDYIGIKSICDYRNSIIDDVLK